MTLGETRNLIDGLIQAGEYAPDLPLEHYITVLPLPLTEQANELEERPDESK